MKELQNVDLLAEGCIIPHQIRSESDFCSLSAVVFLFGVLILTEPEFIWI